MTPMSNGTLYKGNVECSQVTVSIDIFVSYIFSRNSRFWNIRENIYNAKLSFIIPNTVNDSKNANLN